MAGPALYLFSSGTLGLGGFEVPVPFYLIRHAAGRRRSSTAATRSPSRVIRTRTGARLADIFEVRHEPRSSTASPSCASTASHPSRRATSSRPTCTSTTPGALGTLPRQAAHRGARQRSSTARRGRRRSHARGLRRARTIEQPGDSDSCERVRAGVAATCSATAAPRPAAAADAGGHSAGHASRCCYQLDAHRATSC